MKNQGANRSSLAVCAWFLVGCAAPESPENPSIAVNQSNLSQRMAMSRVASSENRASDADSRNSERAPVQRESELENSPSQKGRASQQPHRSPPAGLDSLRDGRDALFLERERERLGQ